MDIMALIPGLIPGLVVAVLWLVGSCILIGKIQDGKVFKIIITVLLFILCVGVFAGVQIGAAIGKNVLQEQADWLDKELKTNVNTRDLLVVRRGVDVSQLPEAINDLERRIPGMIANTTMTGRLLEPIYKKALAEGFKVVRTKTDAIAGAADEEGRISSTIIIKNLVEEINAAIKRVVLYTQLVLAFILALVLVIRIVQVIKSRKKHVVLSDE
ncbi:MAG: hypothetical protein FWD36_01330 [Treponema sp.]|nr:hypothetical protein [Treponema sp.]